jgi:hypothetical protein
MSLKINEILLFLLKLFISYQLGVSERVSGSKLQFLQETVYFIKSTR